MSKQYNFTIHACEAERGSNGMVMFMPMSTVYRETFQGTVDELSNRIQSIKSELSNRQFEAGKGFSISPILAGGQRKPAGYDKKRHQISTNYIA
jgi:hypothetical protein